MSELTARQKAAATVKAKRERQQAEAAAVKNDRQRAIEICRAIRDSAGSTYADRLKAIELLAMYTAGSRRPT